MVAHASIGHPRARVVHGAIGESRWEVATVDVDPRLSRSVRGLAGYDESSAGRVRRRELPGTRVVVCFELGAPLRIGEGARTHRGGFVAGLAESPTLTEHDGAQRGIQLDLSPLAAGALFGVPFGDLAGRVVSLDDVFARSDRHHLARLADASDWTSRLHVVHDLVRSRLAPFDPRSDLVQWALDRIEASGGAIETRALASALGYSEKHVIRAFRARVGVTPGAFARLVRFERLVDAVKRSRKATWASLAAEVGYYDQPHLVREVKRLTGATPTAFARDLVDLAQIRE